MTMIHLPFIIFLFLAFHDSSCLWTDQLGWIWFIFAFSFTISCLSPYFLSQAWIMQIQKWAWAGLSYRIFYLWVLLWITFLTSCLILGGRRWSSRWWLIRMALSLSCGGLNSFIQWLCWVCGDFFWGLSRSGF